MVRKSLTYDDILLVPRYSEITSREMVKLKTRVSKRYGILIPYVASCMDTVCDKEMAKSLMSLGGVGCIHRFMSIEEQCKQIEEVSEHKKECVEEWGIMFDDWHTEIADIPVMAAIGVMPEDVERAKELVKSGANVILIDVAHGHHLNVKNMVEKLKSELPNHVDIIGGNIATTKAAIDLCDWGVDGLRVGIGGGCFTPNMEVKTKNGNKKIKDIELGDEVYTHTGELKPVINKFEYEDYEEIYDIDGIEATPNHKFYVVHKSKESLVDENNIHEYAEWVSAEDLSDEYFLIEL